MKKIVIGLSGGMDSATLLGMLLETNYEVHACSFIYGSKHNKFENEAVFNIVKYYQNLNLPVILHPFEITRVFSGFKSNLLLNGGEIPEGHYEDENMKLTVVPGRNLIFASIMAGLAESIGAEAVALGVHAGDHAIYPDCRPDFINALRATILASSDKAVTVVCPLINMTKTDILQAGYYNVTPPVPFHLTRTCYKDQPDPCGKCGSCVERAEAFEVLGIVDQTIK